MASSNWWRIHMCTGPLNIWQIYEVSQKTDSFCVFFFLSPTLRFALMSCRPSLAWTPSCLQEPCTSWSVLRLYLSLTQVTHGYKVYKVCRDAECLKQVCLFIRPHQNNIHTRTSNLFVIKKQVYYQSQKQKILIMCFKMSHYKYVCLQIWPGGDRNGSFPRF